MRLVLMGPPGAGKGTQAGVIAAHFGVPAISTGDIFRANAAAQTPLGLEAKRYMDAGNYVPDTVTNAMVRDRIGQADAGGGFLLDGYPRTVAQVEELDTMLADLGQKLDAAVVLTVDEDLLAARLLRRAQVEDRADDTEEVIRHRLVVYREQTEPLLAVYHKRGLLLPVPGADSVEEVSERVFAELERFLGSPGDE